MKAAFLSSVNTWIRSKHLSWIISPDKSSTNQDGLGTWARFMFPMNVVYHVETPRQFSNPLTFSGHAPRKCPIILQDFA